MLTFPCTKNTPISVYCINIAHTAFCMFIQYGRELHNVRMLVIVIKTFEHRQQSADDCLHILVHENMHYLLPSLLSRMFPYCTVKAGARLVPAPATGHRGQRYQRSCTHASLLRDACMLIMIQKRTMHGLHAYLKR